MVCKFTDYFTNLRMEKTNVRNPALGFLSTVTDTADPDYAIPGEIDAMYSFAHSLHKFLDD